MAPFTKLNEHVDCAFQLLSEIAQSITQKSKIERKGIAIPIDARNEKTL